MSGGTVRAVIGIAALLTAGPIYLYSEVSTPKQSLSDSVTQKMIDEMIAARVAGRAIQPPTQSHGSFPLEEAYRIQKLLAQRLTPNLGDVVGYKVAYASEAAQKQFGIPGPASAPLFELQRVPSGTALRASEFLGVILETEVAFTVGRRIDRRIADAQDLRPYVRWAHPSFDLGNSRFAAGAKPTASDQVAAGIGAHFFVLGPALDPGAIDLDEVVLKLDVKGKTVRESPAKNVMGSPWNSLRWLANQLIERGDTLEPGDVVLTGTAAPAWSGSGAEIIGEFLGDCGPLGQVRCSIK